MDLFTLNRKFLREDVIDHFFSAIWTERYYGDSDIELIVPTTSELIEKLSLGTFVGLQGSNEIMIIETLNFEEGKLTANGISLLSWLDNRFVRTSEAHEDSAWTIEDTLPGEILWMIVYNMCVAGSPYLNGTNPTGITNPQQLAIPGLTLKDFDKSGEKIPTIDIPFGPVYSVLADIAKAYKIGMQITLESATDTSYILGFRSYKGLNRTSFQDVNPVVRFSPQIDSLTNIKELQSIAMFKTLVYAFASNNPDGVAGDPGIASLSGTQYSGFDLRASQLLEEVPVEAAEADPQILLNILNTRAQKELAANSFISAVDGELVPLNQFKYGIHYNLGDFIEVQGNSGAVQISQVTEYIRAQDEAGERAYPTLGVLE